MTTQTGSISFESTGGLKSYAKQNYATLSQIKGQFATCGTGASTAAKIATIMPTSSNWELYNGATVTVKFISKNTTIAPTLNVNNTGNKPIKDYNGNDLTSDAYNWPEGAAMAFTYDENLNDGNGAWRLQDSNLMERVHNAESSIEQTANSIVSLVTMNDNYTQPDGTTATNNLKSYINQTAEGIAQTVSNTYATKNELSNVETSVNQTADSITSLAAANATYTAPDGTIQTNQTAAKLELKANKATLTSEINASADTVKINADRIEINGTTTFKNNNTSTTLESYLNNNYDAAGSANTVNTALNNYITSTNSTLEAIQRQVDGQIEAWYFDADPSTIEYTANAVPTDGAASLWIDNDSKEKHIGDLYYNINTGHSWRWMYNENNSTYKWLAIPDSDAAAALAAIVQSRHWYAECTTAGGVAAKAATISPATTEFNNTILTPGTIVLVKFINTNSAAINNLTLSINGTTAAPIKYNYNGNFVNIPGAGYLQANQTYAFTYVEVNSNNHFWIADINTDTIWQTRNNNPIKAETNITAGHIIVGTSAGYKNLDTNVIFDLSYPLLYAENNIIENNTGTDNYLQISIDASVNNTVTIESGMANKILYLKGKISGNLFTVAVSPYLTTIIPSHEITENGYDYVYIPLGIMSSTTEIFFDNPKNLYACLDGKFRQVTPTEIISEQYIYNQAISGTISLNGTTVWVTSTSECVTGTPPNAATNQTPLWSTKHPTYQTNYPITFIAKQTRRLDNTVTCTTPVKDDSYTIIDGGNIITGTVTANQIASNTITANEIATGTITANEIASNTITANEITTENIVGTNGWINLAEGTFQYGGNKDSDTGISWDGSSLSIVGSNLNSMINDSYITNSMSGRKIITTNAAELPVISFNVEGECVQEDTPTPTMPVPIQCVRSIYSANDEHADCIAVQSIGKNLLITDEAIINSSNFDAFDIYLSEPLESDQEYTLQLWDVDISHDSKTTNNINITVCYCGEDVVLGGWEGEDYFVDGHADNLILTFTPHFDIETDTENGNIITENNLSHSSVTNTAQKFIRLYNSVPYVEDTMDLTVDNIQLEYGSEATNYQSYISNITYIDMKDINTNEVVELYGLNDLYKDYLNVNQFGNINVQKQVQKIVFDGSEDEEWLYEDGYVVSGILDNSIAAVDNDINTTGNSICSHYELLGMDEFEDSGSLGYVIASNKVYLRDETNATSLNDWKSWLALNPITIYYPLLEAQTISIEHIDLPSLFFNGTVKVIAEIQPFITETWWTETGYAVGDSTKSITSSITQTANSITSLVSADEFYITPNGDMQENNLKSLIDQNAENIELRVEKNGIISSINQSAEDVRIQANKVEIDGTTIFTTIQSDIERVANSAVNDLENYIKNYNYILTEDETVQEGVSYYEKTLTYDYVEVRVPIGEDVSDFYIEYNGSYIKMSENAQENMTYYEKIDTYYYQEVEKQVGDDISGLYIESDDSFIEVSGTAQSDMTYYEKIYAYDYQAVEVEIGDDVSGLYIKSGDLYIPVLTTAQNNVIYYQQIEKEEYSLSDAIVGSSALGLYVIDFSSSLPGMIDSLNDKAQDIKNQQDIVNRTLEELGEEYQNITTTVRSAIKVDPITNSIIIGYIDDNNNFISTRSQITNTGFDIIMPLDNPNPEEQQYSEVILQVGDDVSGLYVESEGEYIEASGTAQENVTYYSKVKIPTTVAHYGETIELGSLQGTHMVAKGDVLMFLPANATGINEETGEIDVSQAVAYIAINPDTKESVFYMTRSVVVKDMFFGEGLWKWYKRSNNNMSLKWMGAI